MTPRSPFLARVGTELSRLLEGAIFGFPGRTGEIFRHRYLQVRLKRMGSLGTLQPGLDVYSPRNISIGDRLVALRNCLLAAENDGAIEIGDEVSLSSNVVVDASDGGLIRIGSWSGIGPNSVLRSSAHHYADPSRPWKTQGHKPGSIIVEEDVWVASNCALLPGSHLGRGCVVASGSVVGGKVEPYSVVMGNPARVVGKRG